MGLRLMSAKNIVEVEKDKGGYWRWTKINSGNHKKVGSSGEAFGSKANAIRAARGAEPGYDIYLIEDGERTLLEPPTIESE